MNPTIDPNTPVDEKMFKLTLDAIYWAMKKYPDATKYRLELKAVVGEGTKAIIYMRDATAKIEVKAQPKKPEAKKKKTKK